MYPVVTADACQPDGCFETNASDLVVCLHGQTFLLLHPVGKHLVAARPPPPAKASHGFRGYTRALLCQEAQGNRARKVRGSTGL